MTENSIKCIPKYILKKIEREDAKQIPTPDKSLRFYAYLTICYKELIKVTVAFKHYCKAVAWHGIHSVFCIIKDIEYNYLGNMGFRVGWYDQGIQKTDRWYERGYCQAKDKYYDPWAIIVNPEVVDKLPEYKYSAYKLFKGATCLNTCAFMKNTCSSKC